MTIVERFLEDEDRIKKFVFKSYNYERNDFYAAFKSNDFNFNEETSYQLKNGKRKMNTNTFKSTDLNRKQKKIVDIIFEKEYSNSDQIKSILVNKENRLQYFEIKDMYFEKMSIKKPLDYKIRNLIIKKEFEIIKYFVRNILENPVQLDETELTVESHLHGSNYMNRLLYGYIGDRDKQDKKNKLIKYLQEEILKLFSEYYGYGSNIHEIENYFLFHINDALKYNKNVKEKGKRIDEETVFFLQYDKLNLDHVREI